MSHDLLVATAIALAGTLLAIVFAPLPGRIDLTTVLAAYGAGSIIGDWIAARRGTEARTLSRRWGTMFAGATLAVLVAGVIGGVAS